MRFFIFLFFLAAIDLYCWFVLRQWAAGGSQTVRWVSLGGFVLLTLFSWVFILAAWTMDTDQWPKYWLTLGRALVFIWYLSKVVAAAFFLLDDLRRLLVYTAGKTTGNTYDASRSRFLTQVGLLAGGLPLTVLSYGILRNPYRYKVYRSDIPIANLPPALDGLKIVQLSDIHSGSFFLKEPLWEVPRLVNAQKPDLIAFTGDMVNTKAEEMEPYVEIFRELAAPLGVFSVRGNHDYGDYHRWPSTEAKQQNRARFEAIQSEMGWQLLKNEHRIVEVKGHQLALIGIENSSALRQFRTYGDLPTAYAGTEDADVRVLLSHDPTWWEAVVQKEFPDIDLTLSGHTHGFQFGIEIPGFVRWSPSQYMYRQWAGLYRAGTQSLYVNRGLGFLGYPGRVGILPEISVLTLRREA